MPEAGNGSVGFHGPPAGYLEPMRKHIRRRIRIQRPGLDANADVNAVISVNVSGSRSEGPRRRSEANDDRSRGDAGRPPSESEGGER
jgi:hypothetical protein